ncbi:MAG: kinase [Deltaproteobacteria bacterium]|jgi:serine/threonine protein kinase|nr:kinase [Deltaproteobacteria bacterium]
MSDIVSVTANDGVAVDFVNKEPKQGGVKDVYFAPDRSYVVAFYRKPLDNNAQERLQRLVGTYRSGIFERQGGHFWEKLFRWPERIVEHNGLTGIVVPIYQPNFFFPKNTSLDGAEKEGKWFTSGKNFNRFVPETEKGNLLSYIKICINLSRAVRRLHAAGLAHSDLSYKNCLVDPASGEACVIDIDGLVVPGLFAPEVLGTPDFMAPEVVETMKLDFDDSNRKFPCRETDQHALAVLIFQYLFHRHPLRGSKVYSLDPETQENLEMGEKALFTEHPTDPTNRYKVKKDDKDFLPWCDANLLPYTITGPYLKALFEKAFITGLHSPSDRPSADDWEEALIKTADLIQPCHNVNCVKKWYVFDNTSRPTCPYCGQRFKGNLPIFDFYSSRDGQNFRYDNRRLMIFSGQYLYPWHVFRTVFPNEKLSDDDKKPVAYFSFHENQWLMVNQTLDSLRDMTHNKLIPKGGYVALTQDLQLLLSKDPAGRLVKVSLVKA